MANHLRVTVEYHRVVTESDLNDFVSLYYGHEYYSDQNADWHNLPCTRYYHVRRERPDLQWMYEEMRQTGSFPQVEPGVLLNDLCAKGYIVPGHYRIVEKA